MQSLILIDGHSLAYRMYFALERTGMRTSQKFPSWGVYGFFKALFDLLRTTEPEGIAVAFDMGRETFRNEMYDAYKAHRNAMPDDMTLQMEKVRQGIDLLGIPVFESPRYEADDLIGTLARQAAQMDIEVTILTGDQDAFQIIDPAAKISILVPSFQGGLVRYDRDKVFEKWGVYPEQVPDFKGLKGDASDNIPGVPGIGDKTAAKLLAQYGTLESVLENTEAVAGNKLKESLKTYREQAVLSKDLATIRYDAPVEFTKEACHLRIPDIDDFLDFLAQMEFRSLINQSNILLQPFLKEVTARGGTLPPMPQSTTKPADNGQGQLDLLNPASSAPVEALHPTDITALEFYSVSHDVLEALNTLEQFVDKIKTTGVFAIDLETSGLDELTCELAGIALSWSPGLRTVSKPVHNVLGLADYPEMLPILEADADTVENIETMYIPICHKDCQNSFTESDVLALLAPIISDPAIAKIVHNGKFEHNVLRQRGIYFKGLVFDTMLASYVVNPGPRHGLKSLAYDVLGHRLCEITELIGKGKKQISFTELGVSEAAPYAACDTHVCIELAAKFIPQLSPKLEALLYEIELPTAGVLADMEHTGVGVDHTSLRKFSIELDTRIKKLEIEIYALAGMEFNLNSPKQVGEVFFEKLKLPARGMTPSKASYSTNAKIIESLAAEFPIARLLLEHRQLTKLKSTYVDALPELIHKRDGRIHTSFNQTVTSTGRLSSSEPNLQNIPIRTDLGRQIRASFVPGQPEDWLILSADYSQIELRLLAHFSQDTHLVSAFCAGEDVHQATASLVFDVPLADVSKSQRYQAKAVNFGIIYGQTAFGLSNSLGIPAKEAGEFINKYFKQYSQVKNYIEQAKAALRLKGTVETLGGRIRDMSEGLASTQKGIREFTERAAFNLPLQGSAADLVKMAMIRLHHAILAADLQSKLILQVHDEIVVEVYKPELEKVKELVLWAMCLDDPLRVPLEIDIAVGPSWMEGE